MLITNGSLVRIHYDMLSEDDTLIVSTRDLEPLEYIHGVMELDPPGLAPALEGAGIGDVLNIVLEPEQAYGPQVDQQNAVDLLPLSSFPAELEIAPGLMFEAMVGQQSVLCTVLGIDGDNVQIYYGHPLAGQRLRFNIDVLDVRTATEEDIAHFQSLMGVNPPA